MILEMIQKPKKWKGALKKNKLQLKVFQVAHVWMAHLDKH